MNLHNQPHNCHCVVLVETSDPGNIGAAARAMFTMGITELRLVKPKFFPHPKAMWRATAASHIVENAKVFDSLQDAIADCTIAVATSARSRSLPWPVCSPRQLASKLHDLHALSKTNTSHHTYAPQVGLVFGRERSGLTNAELQNCHLHCVIPASERYPVLNLSHAVQILCYELFCFENQSMLFTSYQSDQPLATSQETQYMLDAFFAMIAASGFTKRAPSNQLFSRLRRLFMRTSLDKMEVSIMHGVAKHLHAMVENQSSK